MNIQSKFPKIPFFISTMFFCVFLLTFFFFYRATNNNNQESQSREEEWRDEALRRDEIKTLDHLVKTMENERAQLETHFAKSSDIVPFLDTIEKLAFKVDAKAEVTSVDILVDHTGLMVGVKASGTFNSLFRFLTLLENSSYELEFIEMDIQKEARPSEMENKKSAIPGWNVIIKIKLLSFIIQ